MVFRLENPSARGTIHCGVMEFTADEGVAYVPAWMMRHIHASDASLIRVINVTIPKATFVQIRPHRTAFIELSNPRVVLEHALRNFATLTQGSTICVQHADRDFLIDIVETRPANAVLVIETDLQVDFLEPKDAKEIEAQKQAEKEAKRTANLFNFGASPVPISPVVPSSGVTAPHVTGSTKPSSRLGMKTTSTTTNGGTERSNYFASLGAGRSLVDSTPATSTTSTASTTSAPAAGSSTLASLRLQSGSLPTTASSTSVKSPLAAAPSTLTTKTIGNFVYYYDDSGKLVKRLPKSQVTTSKINSSQGRSLQ